MTERTNRDAAMGTVTTFTGTDDVAKCAGAVDLLRPEQKPCTP